MANDKTLAALFLPFLAGVGIVIAFRLLQVRGANSQLFPQESSYTFKVPEGSLKGVLIAAEGIVEKKPREEDEFEKVSVNAEILQGERLATKEESQAEVEFSDLVTVSLHSNSEIGLVSLIPENFLIEQSSGSIRYEFKKSNASISIRSLHTLVSFYSGEGELTVEGEEIEVKITSGRAKLALVGLDNKTHVWELEEGQEALVNDSKRRVEIK